MKLIGKWDSLTQTMNFLRRSFKDMLYFSFLLALFIFLFAIIGVTLFANKIMLDPYGNIDYVNGASIQVINFNNIGYAFLSAFILQIGDNWTSFFYQYTRFSNASYIYFPIAIFVLNIVIMNLFVAIMLEKFFSDDKKDEMEAEERRNKLYEENQKKAAEQRSRGKYRNRVRTLLIALKTYNTILKLGGSYKKNDTKDNLIVGCSLNIFSSTSEIRIAIKKILKHIIFIWLRYLFIALNSIIISFTTTLNDPNGTTLKTMTALDIVTTIFFCTETVGRIIVCGFIFNGPKSFLRKYFNVLDFTITLLDVITLIFSFTESSFYSIILLIRAMRVFRLINVNKGFRLRMKAVALGLPKIVQTMLITVMFILMFGVIGVQLFMDLFYYCSTENINDDTEIVTVYDCMNNGAEWINRDINFDNIMTACMTLFEMFTGKSWCNIVTFLSNAKDYDRQPERDTTTYNLWYPVIYMLFAFLCIRSMLTGVISNCYYFFNEKIQGLRELTSTQRRWVSLTRVIFKASPVRTYDPSVKYYKLYEFLIHPVFNYFIIFVVTFNGVVLCLEFHRSSDGLKKFVDTMHWIFIVIYIAEASLKIFFYKADYFRNGWNIFDLIIVTLLLITTIVKTASANDVVEAIIFLIRAFKICVMFKKLKLLHDVFQIFVLALPSVVNLALLLFIMMYMFAIFGICLFSTIKLQSFLDNHANFQNIIKAFLTVYRLSTYDGWNDIMHDTMRVNTQYFYCVDYPTYNDVLANGGDAIGCGFAYASVYFILFILIIPFMFLNIFVAIVVASVMEIAALSESVLSDQKLEEFLNGWTKYDPKGEGYIEYDRMWHLLYEIPEPLGAAENEMNNRFYSAITLWMLQLSIYRHKDRGWHYIAFYDVLEALVKKCLYRPQTLNEIYHNESKDKLVAALQELWDQKNQLDMNTEEYMNRMEDLRYYYESKKVRESKSKFKLIRVNLPLLVLIILKLSKNLRSKAKERHRRERQEVGLSVTNEESGKNINNEFMFDMFENPIAAGCLIQSAVNESSEEDDIGEHQFRHNLPNFSEKMKKKSKYNQKTKPHNVPLTTNRIKTIFGNNDDPEDSGRERLGLYLKDDDDIQLQIMDSSYDKNESKKLFGKNPH